jgi:glycosyltransferase involved in cell wall biosynthesis
VTIGLPFYNAQATLERALQSIFAQTFRDWELLLLDDGSTDNSLEIAHSVRDGRVRVFSDGMNVGLPRRLNDIVALAETPFVARMDADDLMHPERIGHQYNYMTGHPDVDVVGTLAISINEFDEPMGALGSASLVTTQRDALQRRPFIHPTIMAKRGWMKAYPYSEAFGRAEDRELWCRTVTSSRFVTIPEQLFFYREPNNVRLAPYVQSCRTDRRIIRKYGPAAAGHVFTTAHVAASHLKEVAYRVSCALGQAHHLVRRRARPLSRPEAQAASEALRTVFRTPLPLEPGTRLPALG